MFLMNCFLSTFQLHQMAGIVTYFSNNAYAYVHWAFLTQGILGVPMYLLCNMYVRSTKVVIVKAVLQTNLYEGVWLDEN